MQKVLLMVNIPCQYQLPGAPTNNRSPAWNKCIRKFIKNRISIA